VYSRATGEASRIGREEQTTEKANREFTRIDTNEERRNEESRNDRKESHWILFLKFLPSSF